MNEIKTNARTAELLDRVKQADHEVDSAKHVANRYRELLAKECPHQPGDVAKVNDISYRGRDMLVEKVTIRTNKGYGGERTYQFHLFGRVINKGTGKPGQNRAQSVEPIDA